MIATMQTRPDPMDAYRKLDEIGRVATWERALEHLVTEGSFTAAIGAAMNEVATDPAVDPEARHPFVLALAELLTLSQVVLDLPTKQQASAFEDGVQAVLGMGISRDRTEALDFLTGAVSAGDDYVTQVYDGFMAESRAALGVDEDTETIPLLSKNLTPEERLAVLEERMAVLAEKGTARVLWASVVEPLVKMVRAQEGFVHESPIDVLCSVALAAGRELRGETD